MTVSPVKTRFCAGQGMVSIRYATKVIKFPDISIRIRRVPDRRIEEKDRVVLQRDNPALPAQDCLLWSKIYVPGR